MDEALRRLALDLFDEGIMLTNGPFNFKLHEKHPDAPHPPIKVNIRFPPRGTLTNALAERIGNTLHRLVCENQLQYDCVVGVPKAGDPLAKVVARLASVPLLFLEKEETDIGRMVLPVLRGEYQKDWRVLIVDDVVVMADSKFEAIAAVKANGLRVAGVEVLVDWEHGGRDDLEKARILVLPRFKMTELILLYLEEGRMSPEKYQEAIAYLRAIRAYFSSA